MVLVSTISTTFLLLNTITIFPCQINGCLRMKNTQELLALPELERNCRDLANEAKYYSQSTSIRMIRPLWQFCLNMMGKGTGDPKYLKGEVIDSYLEAARSSNAREHHLLIWHDVHALKLAYLFGDIDLAGEHIDGAKWVSKNYVGSMAGACAIAYYSLFLLAQARRNKQRYRSLRKVRQNLRTLKKAVEGCPENFLGKQMLVEAELAAVCGKISAAKSKYRLAILQNRDSGFWIEEALANEQLGKVYMEESNEDDGIAFLREAHRLYGKGAASAKVQHLIDEYGDTMMR